MMIIIIIHHIQVFVETKNYTVPVVLIYILSIIFLPIFLGVDNMLSSSMLYQEVYSQLLH